MKKRYIILIGLGICCLAASPLFTTIELGTGTDTTLSRSAAGVLAVEGVDVLTTSNTKTVTNKTLTSPVLTTPDLGTPSALVATNATGTATGLTAGNATKWTTGRTIALTGDVTYTSSSLDGSGNVTGVATLAATQANITSAANLATVGTITTGVWNAGAVTSSGGGSFTTGAFSGQLTNALGTITTSKPLSISETWNASGVTFSGLKMNVTDQAANAGSAAGSLLFDLQCGTAGTTSVFSVAKQGYAKAVRFNPTTVGGTVGGTITNDSDNILFLNAASAAYTGQLNTTGLQLPSASLLQWGTVTSTSTLTLSQSSAGVLNIGTTTNNALGAIALANITASGNLTIGGGTAILKHLSASATLDFGSTAAGGVTDLTVTVTGAALSDTVAIGIPNGSVVAGGDFTAWVSATSTVTVRFSNNSLVTAYDPASGIFRADVWQH